jgi:hypothetical protein
MATEHFNSNRIPSLGKGTNYKNQNIEGQQEHQKLLKALECQKVFLSFFH